MKDIMIALAGYNFWANQRLIAVLRKLTPEQADQPMVSSFSGIRPTVLHMWDAESVWRQRIELTEPTRKPSETFIGTFAQVCDEWLESSRLLLEWVKQASPAKLSHTVAYYNSQKQYAKLTVIEILMHVFNHATYHRGQLVTLLRQTGVTKIPGTDYNGFTKSRKM